MGTLGAYASTGLLPELLQGRALDVAEMAYGDDHGVVGIEVFGIELMLVGDNLRATLIAVFLFHFLQIVFHHFLAEFGVIEDLLQIFDLLLQFVKLLVQLVGAQFGELCQTHVDNSL